MGAAQTGRTDEQADRRRPAALSRLQLALAACSSRPGSGGRRSRPEPPIELGLTAAMVAQLFAQGNSPKRISAQLGLAKSTVSHHLGRLGLEVGRGYMGRRVVVEILGRGGPRASELCDIKIDQNRSIYRTFDDGPCRNRTCNLGLKRPLLCQLS